MEAERFWITRTWPYDAVYIVSGTSWLLHSSTIFFVFISITQLVFNIHWWGPSWAWSYGSWIYNYLYNHFPITTKIVSSNLVHCEVYSIQHYVIEFVSNFQQGTPVSSTNKTDHHYIAEIFLKVALNSIISVAQLVFTIYCLLRQSWRILILCFVSHRIPSILWVSVFLSEVSTIYCHHISFKCTKQVISLLNEIIEW